jgi:peptide/nickel transport system substrate-binding protein
LCIASTALIWCAATHAAELSIGISADVTSLDPQYLATQHNVELGWNVFGALTRVDEKARIIPGLAVSWRAIDPLTWEFKLRKGVKFHDGSEMTADDVVYSLVRPLAIAGSPGGFAVYVRRIVSKQIVDPYTIRLKTATPYGAMPQDMNAVMIVSKKAAFNAKPADFDSGKAMIGTGPYKFVRWTRGDRIELERFEGYWEKKPAWDKVTFRMMSNDPARTAALLAGDVDVIENVPPSDIERFRNAPNIHLEQTVSWRTIFFHMDQFHDQAPQVTDLDGKPLSKNPFKDVRVRRAISKAINRKALVERAMENLAVPASNVVSPQIFGHHNESKPEPYDPDGAKKLLADAGYPKGFAMTVSAPNDRYVNDDQVAQAVAQMLSKIGIKCAVEAMPFNVYLTMARDAQFSFAMLGWGSYASDLALRALLMTPNVDKGNGAWNWGHYSNPKVDKLVEEALDTVDDAKREALARQAAGIAAADVAIIPLHHQIVTWAMKKNIAYQARTDERSLAQFFRPQ